MQFLLLNQLKEISFLAKSLGILLICEIPYFIDSNFTLENFIDFISPCFGAFYIANDKEPHILDEIIELTDKSIYFSQIQIIYYVSLYFYLDYLFFVDNEILVDKQDDLKSLPILPISSNR